MASNSKIKGEIVSLLIDHSRIIYNIISDMAVYFSSWSEGKSKHEKKKNKMQIVEEEADEIKVKIIEYSDVGVGLGDLIGLVLKMDNVINYPLEFVDILNKIHLDQEQKLRISEQYHKLINKIIGMADVLKTTIKNLRDNQDKVFNNTTEIHEIENEIDYIYREFLEELYSNEDIPVRMILRIRDSIVLLEQLADRIHDIADVIRVILYQ